MRMVPTRYLDPRPAQVKKEVAKIAHLSPPLKGLNLATKTAIGDPLTAVILTNFIVQDDRITCRGGYRMTMTVNSVKLNWVAPTFPCSCEVPLASVSRFVAGNKVRIEGVTKSGMLAANGLHTIGFVDSDTGIFTLDNVDCSAGLAGGNDTGAIYASLPNSGAAIWHLVPWHGSVQNFLAATSNSLYAVNTGQLVKGGFSGGDWHWTAFSNLSQTDYTVMVNGANGVWSWDGSLTAVDHAPVVVTALSNTSPAQVTVAAADISKFYDGQIVHIAGADPAHAAANGYHPISLVGSPANTFKMVGVDLTATTAVVAPTNITANPPGTGVVNETVTAPASAPWVTPLTFSIVCAHMNRLFFADAGNLAVYYLPIQQKAGEVKILPLNAIFKRGGYIKAMFTWSVDGGTGLDDLLCIFTSNGECAIYSGTDPDSNFTIKGVFHFDAPMSKHSIVAYGGELYVLVSTGLIPMSTLMRAEGEQLGQVDQNVLSLFSTASTRAGEAPGWQTIINPQSGRLYCNIPQGATNVYRQMVRHMPSPEWSEFRDIPARCWGWLYPYMWFGDDRGNIYQGHTDFLNDDGRQIQCDVQMAWSQFKLPGVKHFKMVKVYYVSDGEVQPAVDVKCDYDFTVPENIPEVTFRQPGAVWGTATWSVDSWAAGPIPTSDWNGVGRLGRVGAVRVKAAIADCEFSITGFDIIYETGAALG